MIRSKLLVILTAVSLILVFGCAVKQPSPSEEVLESTLPEATEVPEEFSEPVDTGYVDDGWLKNFNDNRLEALVAEVLENNQNLQKPPRRKSILRQHWPFRPGLH